MYSFIKQFYMLVLIYKIINNKTKQTTVSSEEWHSSPTSCKKYIIKQHISAFLLPISIQ